MNPIFEEIIRGLAGIIVSAAMLLVMVLVLSMMIDGAIYGRPKTSKQLFYWMARGMRKMVIGMVKLPFLLLLWPILPKKQKKRKKKKR